jgi:VanZ family protein
VSVKGKGKKADRPDGGQRKKLPASRILCFVFLGLALLWLAFIFSNSLKSAEESAEDSGKVLAFLQGLFPSLTVDGIRKLAHFAEFFVLGALGTASLFCYLLEETVVPEQPQGQPLDQLQEQVQGQPQGEAPEQPQGQSLCEAPEQTRRPKQKQRLKRSDLLQHGAVLLFIDLLAGLTDETLQHFSPGRAAQVADVWLDAAGFIAGAVIVATVWLIIDAAGRKVVK